MQNKEFSFPKHYYIIAVLIGLLLGSSMIGCAEHEACLVKQQKVELYKQYYKATEALLDSLEENFNWSDRYDSEAIDNYYDARRKLY